MTVTGALVLVVEDDFDVRDAVTDVLRESGYDVAVASDGEEALQKLKGGLAPALILLDLMMPRMDGFAFRDEQLRLPAVASIPVVVLSAARGLLDRSRHLGAAAYLEKPVPVSELLGVVERLAGRP